MNTKANVSMDDGLLEVLLVKMPRNPMELQGAIAALLLNDFNNPCLHAFHTSTLRISATEEISWTLDGEFGGELQDVQIGVLHKAYEIIIPAEEAGEKQEAIAKKGE